MGICIECGEEYDDDELEDGICEDCLNQDFFMGSNED